MKIKDSIKFRKEDFGWLACDIKTCCVFLISNEIKNTIDQIQQNQEVSSDSKEILELKSLGFLK